MSNRLFYISDNNGNLPIHRSAACCASTTPLKTLLKGHYDTCYALNNNYQTPLDVARACNNTIAEKFLTDNCHNNYYYNIYSSSLCGILCPFPT